MNKGFTSSSMLFVALGVLSIPLPAVLSIPWYVPFLSIGGGVLTLLLGLDENGFEKLFTGMKFCNAVGDMPKLTNSDKTEYGCNYTFSLPPGLNIQHFIDRKLSIEQFLNAKVKFEYAEKSIIAYTTANNLSDFYPFVPLKTEHPCEFWLGHFPDGLRKIKLDRHMLIAGTSGFGKSTLEYGMITQFIMFNTPDKLILNLCDFKRCDLGIFKNSNMVNTFCYTVEGLMKLLKRIGKEVERRYDLFDSIGVKDIESYNATHEEKLKYIVNFYDEISQLEGNEQIYKEWQKRLAIDRGAGVFHVLCTQRPSADLLPGRIKANLDIRVCFKTVDSTNSWIVLDQKDTAEYLNKKGRGLLKYSADLEEFQAMFIDENYAIERIRHTFVTKEVQNDNRQR